MKVLHVIPSFYPARALGGPVEATVQLCRHLGRLGCEVRVLTTDADGEARRLDVPLDRDVPLEEGVVVRYCGRVLFHSVAPTLVWRLPSWTWWGDVIHLTAVYSFPTIPTLLAGAALARRVVWSPRGALQRWNGSTRVREKAWWERACRVARPRRLVLHVTSDEERQESLGRLPGCDAVVVPNGVEVPARVEHVPGADALRLLYLGRIHPKKGLENLIDACAILRRERRISWSLTLAGDGEEKYLELIRHYIRERELGEQISMRGWAREDEKKRLFEQSDVLVLPSHTENFGNVVAEALAHGVPVIASRNTPWARVAEVGCGLWVENDSLSLAGAIEQITRMPLQELGRRGRAWMEREFAWPAVARRMIEVYRDLATTGSVSSLREGVRCLR